MFKIRFLSSFTIFLFVLSLSTQATAQSYANYESSNSLEEPSLEALIFIYEPTLIKSRAYFKTLLKEEMDTNTLTEVTVNYFSLRSQIKYLKKQKYQYDKLRISVDSFDIMNTKSQEQYLKIINRLEEKYSISEKEYRVIKQLFTRTKDENSDLAFLRDMNTFEEYMDLAYELKYSKLEIFRDFSGYWRPKGIIKDHSLFDIIKKFYDWEALEQMYRNPLDHTSTNAKHGLKATEALRRLLDIKKSKALIINAHNCNSSTPK